MSLGAIARRAAKQVIHEAYIKVPPAVQVSKTADLLTFKGPLGTSHLGLSRIDTLGDAALKLSPESREIAICSPSKGFFGTLQVTIKLSKNLHTCATVAAYPTPSTPLCIAPLYARAKCTIVSGGAPSTVSNCICAMDLCRPNCRILCVCCECAWSEYRRSVCQSTACLPSLVSPFPSRLKDDLR